ncbi:MAG: hypothetical protein A2277_09460 [Desulfobacterales bacterium RIFOXYA12_FULL_46_15]|nr:MAG: hypothetical protein A2277_09460 [Desulfobacterales bacterium RIFOXYA12_FULL_46_15]
MKKDARLKAFIFIILSIYTCIAVPHPSHSKTSSVKTSYKRYSIIKYKGEDILCEPYKVNKNDWLYKILRKKGEISEKDFPHFISIFKEINPDISDIDAIQPGTNILIPLKKINKDEYNLSTPDNVDVPVVKFSTSDKDPDLQPFLKKHIVQNGETTDSTYGKEKKQETINNRIEAYKLAKLKQYSSLIGGVLLSQGKIYFPGDQNSTCFIDLSSVPVIETNSGEKIIITSDNTLSDELIENIKSYWRDLKTQSLSEVLEKIKDNDNASAGVNSTIRNKKMIQSLLFQAGFNYITDAKIPFTLNHISLEATFGRVTRKDSTDLLINFGNVYGSALEVLEKQKFEIITIAPELKASEMIGLLFSSIGYSTWENPSFSTGETVDKITGIYAVREEDKLFIPIGAPSTSAIAYLKKENIKILSIE